MQSMLLPRLMHPSPTTHTRVITLSLCREQAVLPRQLACCFVLPQEAHVLQHDLVLVRKRGVVLSLRQLAVVGGPQDGVP